MDLDAVGRRRFNRLPDKEFQRRRRERLCFRCGKGKHAAKDCRGGTGNVKIRGMEAWKPEDPQEEESLNEESPSDEMVRGPHNQKPLAYHTYARYQKKRNY